MATTEEVISILEQQFVGWPRDGARGILTYLNIAHSILCNVPNEQFIIFNESTGQLPAFDTTEGTYSYDLPNNVNNVDAVMVEADAQTTLIDQVWAQDYGRVTRVHRRPKEQITIAGVRYIDIPYVRSYPRTEDAVAKVVFTLDPNTTTDVYRYRGYKTVTPITSDSIQLSIPPPYDIKFLVPATSRLMEGVQEGKFTEALDEISNKYEPMMQLAFNKGAQGIYYEAEDRGF